MSGNSANYGGAIYDQADFWDSYLHISNTTLHGNNATVTGGAIFAGGLGGTFFDPPLGASTSTLDQVTFSGNTAAYGGAIYGSGAGFWGHANFGLVGVILRDDSATIAFPEFGLGSQGAANISYSVIEGGCEPILNTTCGAGNLDADPLLAPLQDNGGPTPTMALLAGSPAIDAGNNTACAAAPVSNLDQRGMTRPVDGNFDATATCDIGAYEYQGHLFADVPVTGKEWMEPWVEAFYYNGITTGCGASPLIYCPENPVTRAAMAVFVLRAKHGASYVPPAATHTFSDMPVAGKEWMEPWVDQLYAEGITSGCGAGPIFCPENPVTRAAMAVFLLRALEGSSYVPPASRPHFLRYARFR